MDSEKFYQIIIEYLIQHNIHANPKLLENIANEIVQFFKSEIKVCES